MLLRFSCFLLLLLTVGCSSPDGPKLPPEPDDLIEEEKLVNVLADVHLLEAALGMRNPIIAPRSPLRPGQSPITPAEQAPQMGATKALPYYDIFKKHGITYKQYEASITWYAAQPERLDVIYEDVIEELSRRQTEATSRKK